MKIKVALLVLLLMLFLFAFISNVLKMPLSYHDLYVDIVLDDHSRPLVISTFFIDRNGVKVKNGETVRFDWDRGEIVRETYRNDERTWTEYRTVDPYYMPKAGLLPRYLTK